MSAVRILKEALLTLGLIAFGLFCLPALIYLVGQVLVGEYDGGLDALYLALADGLAAGQWFAWVLVTSPYVACQLFRIWLRLGSGRRSVTELTESGAE